MIKCIVTVYHGYTNIQSFYAKPRNPPASFSFFTYNIPPMNTAPMPIINPTCLKLAGLNYNREKEAPHVCALKGYNIS